jgi:hypothetical protein
MDQPDTNPREEDRLEPRADEEALVMDTRAGLRPAQIVERKLASLLQTGVLPLSQLRGGRPPRDLV